MTTSKRVLVRLVCILQRTEPRLHCRSLTPHEETQADTCTSARILRPCHRNNSGMREEVVWHHHLSGVHVFALPPYPQTDSCYNGNMPKSEHVRSIYILCYNSIAWMRGGTRVSTLIPNGIYVLYHPSYYHSENKRPQISPHSASAHRRAKKKTDCHGEGRRSSVKKESVRLFVFEANGLFSQLQVMCCVGRPCRRKALKFYLLFLALSMKTGTYATEAVCADGSPGHFYMDTSLSSRDFVFYLQGGMQLGMALSSQENPSTLTTIGCAHDTSLCGELKEDFPRLFTSDGFPETMSAFGMMSGDTEENGLFGTFNRVYVPYCTADMYTLDTESEDGSLQFRGRPLLE